MKSPRSFAKAPRLKKAPQFWFVQWFKHYFFFEESLLVPDLNKVAQLFMAHLAEHDAELLVCSLLRNARKWIFDLLSLSFQCVCIVEGPTCSDTKAARHNFRTLDQSGVNS